MGRWAEGPPCGRCAQAVHGVYTDMNEQGCPFLCLGVSSVLEGNKIQAGKRLHLSKGPLLPGSGPATKCLTFLSWLPLRANVLETNNKTFLKTCRFSSKNLYCPIFRLGSIVRWAGADFQDIALKVCGMWCVVRELSLGTKAL